MKNDNTALIANFEKAIQMIRSSAKYAMALSATIKEYEMQNPAEKVKIGDETYTRLDRELTDLFIKTALI